jgi:F0F1-type ATP synthase assembly protein I
VSRPDGPELSQLLGLGVTITAFLLVGLGLGWLADEALGSLPVFVLIGMALGIAGASGYVYAQFKKFMKD